MRKYKYIIVEDIPNLAEDLRYFIDRLSNYECKGIALCLNEAIQLIQSYKPEVVFLDIELNQESGFDLIPLIEQSELQVPCIIVNSVKKDYAIHSFKIDAIDFIAKPYTMDKVKEALALFEKRYRKANDTLLIRNKDGEHFIKYDDILFIEAQGTYSHLFTTNNEMYRFSKNLKEMEDFLSMDFLRVQRSYIVNRKHIQKTKNQKMYLKSFPINSPLKEIDFVVKNGIVIT
ncbi:LytR/AlgR family response regulator transcription factor [Mongoliitalea lutea]|uniref:DNA-binding response regulator n=1 Tax=Mongoliitalea lutea TaxID=849756 RepID=A0A8J3G763_9BACT|nr:LytTR family DNA-binding domain-containing protein [Mongoliitalea lutea]GHB53140.1 DNA-binding response regulator [Mongoliitalea lutea]